MNRAENCFKRLRSEGRKALIVYLTAGYPDLETTVELVPELARAGADVIELGVPFSDPVADGVTIQRANIEALEKGVNLYRIMEMVSRTREKSQVPLMLMGYYNPVLAFGPEKFCAACASVGVDGLIIADLPPGEATVFRAACRSHGIGMVFLLAPNSPPDRVRLVARLSTPFIYCVSIAGITGSRFTVPGDISKRVSELRQLTSKPICLGFGISAPAQAAALAEHFDGVIVGSALMKKMAAAGPAAAVSAAGDFVRELSRAING